MGYDVGVVRELGNVVMVEFIELGIVVVYVNELK